MITFSKEKGLVKCIAAFAAVNTD